MSDSVLGAEIGRFDALAGRWWDPRGPMRALHAMNPARIGWIDDQLRGAGLGGGRILDIGCGAGIAAEALAAAGHVVLGVDAAPAAIAAARDHAGQMPGLVYEVGTAEALLARGERFDAVTALEVIEHVADPAAFVGVLARLVAPGGMVVVSTLDRSPLSWLVAKFGAEYVARIVPAGTHRWRQFVTPAELARWCRLAGLVVCDVAGLVPGLDGGWRVRARPAVNYLLCARL